MNDTLIGIQKELPPQPQKIQISTPIGTIETGDDSPILDGLIVVLVFCAFCFYVYARYFRKSRD